MSTRPRGFSSAASCSLLLSALAVAGCGDSGSVTDPNATGVTVAEVAQIRVEPGSATLLVGETVQLRATVLVTRGPVPQVTWSSSNPLVAIVTPRGLVTALAVGSVGVTATAFGRSGSAYVSVGGR